MQASFGLSWFVTKACPHLAEVLLAGWEVGMPGCSPNLPGKNGFQLRHSDAAGQGKGKSRPWTESRGADLTLAPPEALGQTGSDEAEKQGGQAAIPDFEK